MNHVNVMHSMSEVVEAIIKRTGSAIVLAIPMGIGKPNHLVNALYRRVKGDPSLTLKILTALSLERRSQTPLPDRRK